MTGQSAARHEASTGLELYLRDIRGDELLTAEEERQLAGAIARGDRAARDRMITANLRLVVKIARDYEGHGLPIDDLIGEGNLGLLRAVKEFDPRFEVRFSTYAAHWIKQAIRHALTNTTATIRLPSHMVGLITKWRRVERHLRRDLGGPPSFEQIADALRLTPTQRDLIHRAFRAQRLRQEGGETGETWAPEEAPDPRDEAPDALLIAADERLDLHRRLQRLDDRERTVVDLRFGLRGGSPLTLKEVGRRLGVTREWVRKIEIRAVRKLDDTPPQTTATKPLACPARRPASPRTRSRRSPQLQIA
jgi:RNA polymerase primary sigma factor